MLMPDFRIREAAQAGKLMSPKGMIEPYEPTLVRKAEDGSPVISYGQSSYGYDVRIANEFKIFTNCNPMSESGAVDPKNFDENHFIAYEGNVCIVPPNSFVLARTLEYFHLPRNVAPLVLTKSTYARVGLYCLTTLMEPEWEGELVLEFANVTPLPVKLYANEGAAQIVFMQGSEPCEVSYADRGGKYMKQRGVQHALT